MHTFKYYLLAPLLISICGIARADRMPDFSWDTVPRYMHVRKSTAFSDEEIDYLASFPLLTFEKMTGSKDFGSTEKGTLVAAEAVKKVNPRTKILYYRNIIVHYGNYDTNDDLSDMDKPFLIGRNENTKLVRKVTQAYDLSNFDVQVWWLRHVQKICSSEFIDGLFVDGNIKVLEPGYLRKDIGEEKKLEVVDGYHKMMRVLPKAIGKDKLILSNIIRARFDNSGLEYIKYFDGSYIEGFEHAVGKKSHEEYLEKGIAAIQKAARHGKMIAFTIGMSNGLAEEGFDETQSAISDFDAAQDRFNYCLALFLICAEENSYFMASDGYGVDRNRSGMWLRKIPEYSYPLGAPRGPAVKKGHIYRRKFKYADVTVDIQNEIGTIDWKKK